MFFLHFVEIRSAAKIEAVKERLVNWVAHILRNTHDAAAAADDDMETKIKYEKGKKSSSDSPSMRSPRFTGKSRHAIFTPAGGHKRCTPLSLKRIPRARARNINRWNMNV